MIVCEGTKTEYDYFSWIKENISIPNGIWKRVDVSHNATLPNDIPIVKPTLLGRKRPKRAFFNPNTKTKEKTRNVLKELYLHLYGQTEGIELYEEVKAVPLRYVAQAKCIQAAQQGLYNEVWAVFDKNGHTHHEEAFLLAKKSNVNIAFSSRSFEHWILLHFEKNSTLFLETVCKDNKGKSLACKKQMGCEGKICLVGYIRTHYLQNYEKENLATIMSNLMKKKQIAFENAISLRNEKQKELEQNKHSVYLLNPYTNVDELLKRLIE